MKDEKCKTIRINRDMHRLAKMAAANANQSLQLWIEEMVKQTCTPKDTK